MRQLKYMIKVILHMDYKHLFEVVGELHRKTGRSSIWLFFDIVYSGLKYGCGFNDYRLYEFYDLTKAQRETYVTRGINNKIVRLLNDPAYFYIVDDKLAFNRKFDKYLKREWLDMNETSKEQFADFMTRHDVIITKPADGSSGMGMEKLYLADFKDAGELYDHIRQTGNTCVEEVIRQNEELNKLYPGSINTYRIVTVLTEGVGHVVYAVIRIGNKGNFVDNVNAGGMCAPIDIDKGIIPRPASDLEMNSYDIHPYTGTRITGFKLPQWKEACDMCLEAHQLIPQMGYIGWDVSISDKGPVFVEGNNFPGHELPQLPNHRPDRIGMLPRFREFVKGI